MEIAIRKAVLDDLPQVVALLSEDVLGRNRERLGTPVDPAYLVAFEAIDRDPNQFQAVAAGGGRIIGCMQVTFIPGLSHTGAWRGQIEGVRVAEAERGHGLGRRMIGWAVDLCRDRGCGLVQLTSDKQRSDAIRFYGSLGFSPSHEGFKLKL